MYKKNIVFLIVISILTQNTKHLQAKNVFKTRMSQAINLNTVHISI